MSLAKTRLGAGAGFAGDRIDPAIELARDGDLDYLVFECLGERTVAAGHARRLKDPGAGHDPLLEQRLRAVLPHTCTAGTKIVTNAGAANPVAAGEVAFEVLRELGIHGRVAVVTGDDVLDTVRRLDPVVWETGEPVSSSAGQLISANAYLGADGIRQALEAGADTVITGRVADPALYLGPLVHEQGWAEESWHVLGAATAVGHLLECAGQLTGGYFADPVTKPVPGMARLGFPFADVGPDGAAVLAKLPTSGGLLDRRTCIEQLLYEVGNPSAYVTPDVVADFSGASLTQVGTDQVRVEGATGRRRPDDLKVTLGYRRGWTGEGQITYAGPRALQRAELAADIVRERLTALHGVDPEDIEVEYVGAGAAFRGMAANSSDPLEVRLRISANVEEERQAVAVGWEVEALYTNGPAAGGGARASHRELVAVQSCAIARDEVRPEVELMGPR